MCWKYELLLQFFYFAIYLDVHCSCIDSVGATVAYRVDGTVAVKSLTGLLLCSPASMITID